MKTLTMSVVGALSMTSAISAQSYFDFTTPVVNGDKITASDGITTADVGMTGGQLTSYAGDSTHWFIVYTWSNAKWESTASLIFNTPVNFGSMQLFDFGNADITVTADSAMSLGSGNLNGYTAAFANGGLTMTLTDNDGSNNTLNQHVTFAGAINSLTITYSTATAEPPFGTSGSDHSRIYFPSGFTTVPEPASAVLLGFGFIGISWLRKR